MSISNIPANDSAFKQRVFIVALIILSVLLSAAALYFLSPGNALSETAPAIRIFDAPERALQV